MRRALLLAGIAGAAALLTTGTVVVAQAHSRAERIEAFKTRLSDLMFCRTGFDIMSSRPHYVAQFAEGGDKEELMRISDELYQKKEHLDLLIAQTIKQANDLPLHPGDRRVMIEEVSWNAELDAVHTAGWVETPVSFLDHINEICEPYLSE